MSTAAQPQREQDDQLRGDTLTFEHVTLRIGDRAIVSDCSFALESGQLTAMIGPSGCGKSTIGFLVGGYHLPDEGTVRLGGETVRGPSHDRLLVFQETALMPWLTTAQNVMFGPRARGMRRRDARAVAGRILSRMGLSAFGDTYPDQLSGGMQRRAELARALVNEPRVMVLDEPFRGLDAMTRQLMQSYYADLRVDTSPTTLFITTDIDEAILLADRLLIMTNLPAKVCEVIEVDLPRPRDREGLLADARAIEIKKRALTIVHAEALTTGDWTRSSNGASPSHETQGDGA